MPDDNIFPIGRGIANPFQSPRLYSPCLKYVQTTRSLFMDTITFSIDEDPGVRKKSSLPKDALYERHDDLQRSDLQRLRKSRLVTVHEME